MDCDEYRARDRPNIAKLQVRKVCSFAKTKTQKKRNPEFSFILTHSKTNSHLRGTHEIRAAVDGLCKKKLAMTCFVFI